MLCRIALVCLLAATPLAAQEKQEQPDHPKVPKDSLLVTVAVCVKGRVIRAADVTQADTTSGYNIRSTTFRIEGKKDVMQGVKEQDGQRAEIVGLIKKSALLVS